MRISQPGDRFEQEADRVADAVMRAPDAIHDAPKRASIGTTTPAVQRQITPAPASSGTAVGADTLGSLGSGQPLPRQAREFFEPRFGRDFGDVRIHADAHADKAARGIDARAFTLGRSVVFSAGEYDPSSTRGRSLLAHELAHVEQQERGGTYIQRSLSVNRTPPSDPEDPFSSMSASAFESMAISEMGSIIHSLCDAFSVDSSGNVVTSPNNFCEDQSTVANGAKGIGCCCLCALTDPSARPWTINVTGLEGPHTLPAAGGGGEFFLHPGASDFRFGSWDVTGARSMYDPVLVAGHEICGHGALIERDIHPDTTLDRVDSDLHDPTVNIENAILAEQGFSKPDRGLATGVHRGESFGRLTLRNFAFNGATIPSSELHKIQLAKDFINANDMWVDVFGHSDLVGSPSDKMRISVRRANAVEHALTHGTRPVSASISKTFSTGATGTGSTTVSGSRIRTEGRSDFDAIPGAAAADLRRVDIDMTNRPAGTEVPPPATPTAVHHVGPSSLTSFIRRRFFGNDCDRKLAQTAWF